MFRHAAFITGTMLYAWAVRTIWKHAHTDGPCEFCRRALTRELERMTS